MGSSANLTKLVNKTCQASNSEERLKKYEKIFSGFHDEFILAAAKNEHDFLRLMLEDSLVVGSIAVDKWCFGPLQRLVMEKNLQLPDDARKKLSDVQPALSDKFKAAILDLKDERRHARAMAVWALMVKLLAKASYADIVATNTTANKVCGVMKYGFTSNNDSVIREALKAWRVLNDVFADDPRWTSDEPSADIEKKVSFILKAVRHVAARPTSAVDVFDTWWHLWTTLGRRQALLFDDVAHELLRFCVGGPTSYLPADASATEIINTAAQSITQSKGVASLTTEALLKSKSMKTAYPISGTLVLKLGECLKSLTDVSDSALSDSLRAAYAKGIRNHAFFVTQCVRIYSLKAKIDDAVADTIGPLWQNLALGISTFLDGEDRSKQLRILYAQFEAWIQESTHGFALISEVIQRLAKSEHLSIYGAASGNLCDIIPKAYAACISRTPAPESEDLRALMLPVLAQMTQADNGDGIVQVVRLTEQLAAHDSVKEEVLLMTWNAIAKYFIERMKDGSEADLASVDKNVLKIATFPLRMVQRKPTSDTDLTSNVKLLKGLFVKSARCMDTARAFDGRHVFLSTIDEIDKQNVFDDSSKNHSLAGVVCEYAFIMAECFPLRTSQSSANSSANAETADEGPESLHRILTFIARCVELAPAATAAETPAKKTLTFLAALPKTPVEDAGRLRLLKIAKCWATLFVRTAQSGSVAVCEEVVRIFAEPMSKMMRVTKENVRFVNAYAKEFCGMIQNLHALLTDLHRGPCDSELLSKLSGMLEIGLCHPSEGIKSEMTKLWRKTFENADSLEYPETFRSAMEKCTRRPRVKFPPTLTADGTKEELFPCANDASQVEKSPNAGGTSDPNTTPVSTRRRFGLRGTPGGNVPTPKWKLLVQAKKEEKNARIAGTPPVKKGRFEVEAGSTSPDENTLAMDTSKTSAAAVELTEEAPSPDQEVSPNATEAEKGVTLDSTSSAESVSTSISSAFADSVAAVDQFLELNQPNAEESNAVATESQALDSATDSKENTSKVSKVSTEDTAQVEKETPVAEVATPVTPSTAVRSSFVSPNTTPEKSSEKELSPATPDRSDDASDAEAFSPLTNTPLPLPGETNEFGVNEKKERSPSILKKACTPSPRGVDKKKNRVNFPMDPVASVHLLNKETADADGLGLLSPSSSVRAVRGSPVRVDQKRLDFDFDDEATASDGGDVVVHRSPVSAARALFNAGGLRASPGAQRLQMLNFGPKHGGGEPLKVTTSTDVSPASSQSPSKENATVANNYSLRQNDGVENIPASTQAVVGFSLLSETNANQAEQELPPLPAMDTLDTIDNASNVNGTEAMDVTEPATDATNVTTMPATASSSAHRPAATDHGVPSSESTVNADNSSPMELAAKPTSTLPVMQAAVDAAIQDAMQAENISDRRRRLISVQRELIKILGTVNEALLS
ncbi:Telomere-associated protein RIF1 [Aphelenchoides avenae]|nr:Telomere-associated protein RIF1 [Aphelenchus avenae]